MKRNTRRRATRDSGDRNRIEVLFQMLHAVNSESLDVILDKLINETVEITKAEQGTVFLLDYGSNELYVGRHQGPNSDIETTRVSIGDEGEPIGRVFQKRRIYTTDKRIRYTEGHEASSLLLAPLVSSEYSLGVLCVCNCSREFPLPEKDERFLTSLTDIVAIAIEKEKRVEESARDQKTFNDLCRVGRRLEAMHDFRILLKEIARSARRVAGADIVILYEYNESLKDVTLPPIVSGELKVPEVLQRRGRTSEHRDSVIFRILGEREKIYATDALSEWVKKGYLHGRKENNFIVREGVASSAALPLLFEDEIVGIIFINFRRPQVFLPDLKRRMEVFASHASLIISYERLISRARNDGVKLNILKEMANIIGPVGLDVGIRKIAKRVHAETGKLMDVSNFYLCLYDKVSKSYSIPYMVDERDRPDYFDSDDLCSGLTDYVRKKKRPIIVTDLVMKGFTEKRGIKIVGTPAAVWMGAPMMARGSAVGVIVVQSYRDSDMYSGEDLDLLADVATLTGIAIDNLSRLRQISRRFDQLSPLVSAWEEIAGRYHSFSQLLQDTLQKAVKAAEERSGVLAQISHGSDELKITHHVGMSCLLGRRIDIGEGLIGRVADGGRSEFLPLGGDSKDEVRSFMAQGGIVVTGGMATPIILRGSVVAVLAVYSSSRGRVFGKRDLNLLKRYADPLATAISNHQDQSFRDSLIELNPFPVIAVNMKGVVVEYNKKAEDLLGVDRDRILYRSVARLYWGGAKESKRIGDLLKSQNVVHLLKTDLRSETNQRIPILLTAAFLKDDSGRPIGSVGMLMPSDSTLDKR